MKTSGANNVQGHSSHNSLYGPGHIGFSANHTSICKPHPVQLRAWYCHGYAIPVSGRKILWNFYPALLTNWPVSGRHLSELKTMQVINRSFQRAWFRQWLWLHYLHPDLVYYCVICVKAVKTGCVNGCGLLGCIGWIFFPTALMLTFSCPFQGHNYHRARRAVTPCSSGNG